MRHRHPTQQSCLQEIRTSNLGDWIRGTLWDIDPLNKVFVKRARTEDFWTRRCRRCRRPAASRRHTARGSPKVYRDLVEAQKLETQKPQSLRVMYRESQHYLSLIRFATFGGLLQRFRSVELRSLIGLSDTARNMDLQLFALPDSNTEPLGALDPQSKPQGSTEAISK